MEKAIMSTKEVWGYVGNRIIWEELREKYGKELLPFRRTTRGDSFWHRDVIDSLLMRAQLEGLLRPKL